MEKKVVEKWVANDGKEFDTFEACATYENDNPLVKYSNDIIAKDYDGKRVFRWDYTIFTLEVKTREAADVLDSIYQDCSNSILPPTPGNQAWSNDTIDTEGRFILTEDCEGYYHWIEFDRALKFFSGSVFPE